MKGLKKLVILFVSLILLSGCVKEKISMTINKDKSMNLEVEMLVSDSLQEENTFDENIKKYEEKGYTVTRKVDDGYSGIVISKKFSNIDDLSKNNGEVVNLGDIMEDNFDTSKLFSLKKGFLKNTYTAKFSFEFDQSKLETETEEELDFNSANEDEVVTTEGVAKTNVDNANEEVLTTGEEETIDLEDDFDYTSLMAGMEFKYIVNLPTSGKNHNATSTSNDSKTLTWNLATTGSSNIEYTFDMYNMTSLIILGVCGLVVLIVIIAILVGIKKKKSSKETLIHTDYDDSIAGEISETVSENVLPTENIPQANSSLEFTNGETANAEPVSTPEIPPMEEIVEEPSVPATPQVEESVNSSIENTLALNLNNANEPVAPINNQMVPPMDQTQINQNNQQ